MQPDSGNNVQMNAPLWWNHKFCKTSSHAFCAMGLQIGSPFACYVALIRKIINSPVASVLLKYIKSDSDLTGIAWELV